MVMRATPSAPTSSKVRPFALLPISQVATTVFLFRFCFFYVWFSVANEEEEEEEEEKL